MRALCLVGTAAVLLTATVAHANSVYTVEATFSGVENKKAVRLASDSGNLYVWAGLYTFDKGAISPDSTANPAYYLDPVFGGYCIDLAQVISPNYTTTWELKPLEQAPVNPTGIVMGPDRATLLRRLWGSHFNDPNAAEFQVAVWELLAENPSNGYGVTTGDGSFYVRTPDDAEVDVSMINEWLDEVAGADYIGDEASVMWAMTSIATQDFAVLIELADEPGGEPSIPEPVTLVGLLTGIGCLTRYVRRRGAPAR
ncbi:MAG TPA: PEP-CTERM sorting domain-containing protein [Phycisphaerae bacterium]|nr:PEP-CTERM sorting domain-containing protein [Phycisphaerae bacterium]